MNPPTDPIIKILLMAAIVVALAAADAFMSSRFKQLNTPGKYDPSFKNNFKRSLLHFSIILGLIAAVSYLI